MNYKNILSLIISFGLVYSCTSATGKEIKLEEFEKIRVESSELAYFLYLPVEYSKTKKPWPLLFFLHGAGERGSDLNLILKHGPPKLIESSSFREPFIVLAPQCPEDIWWPDKVEELKKLLDEILINYRVDKSRVYLTGLSMGGYGTWAFAKKYPDTFAAIAPICGGGKVKNMCLLKDMPVWAFHGAKDTVVPMKESEILISTLEQCGSKKIKYTIYPDATHNSWSKTYSNPDLYTWFLTYTNEK